MKKVYKTTLCIVLFFCLSSCSSISNKGMTKSSHAMNATLITQPDPLFAMQTTDFILTLTDSAGKPLEHTNVSLSLTMPGMTMAGNHPAVIEIKPGVFTASTMLTMAGKWKLAADIQTINQSETFEFEMEVR